MQPLLGDIRYPILIQGPPGTGKVCQGFSLEFFHIARADIKYPLQRPIHYPA